MSYDAASHRAHDIEGYSGIQAGILAHTPMRPLGSRKGKVGPTTCITCARECLRDIYN